MKFFKDKYSQSGFSTVEALVGIGLLGGLVTIALWQTDFTNKSMNELQFERNFMNFHSGLEGFINDPDICEKNFVGKSIDQNYTSLVDKDGVPVYQIETGSFINGEVKIKGMRTFLENENTLLEVNFEKIKNNKKQFSRRIELMVDVESGVIKECFNPALSIAETVQMMVSKKICEKTYGVGTADFYAHFTENNSSCTFDGYPEGTLNQQCPTGQAITGISYNISNHEMSYNCSQVISSLKCPDGWVRRILQTGQSECSPLPLDTSSVTITTLPTTCKLAVTAQNKIKLDCASQKPITPVEPPVGPNCSSSCFQAGYDCQWSNGISGTTLVKLCNGHTVWCGPNGLSTTTGKSCL